VAAGFLLLMETIEQKIIELKALTVDQQERDILLILQKFKEILIDFNTSQLMSGKNSKGQSLGDYASDSYAKLKRSMNPKANGHVDLYFEGDWQESFFLEAQSFPVLFNASNWKTNLLVTNYGEDVFGIDEDNLEKFIEGYLLQAVQQYYLRKFSFL